MKAVARSGLRRLRGAKGEDYLPVRTARGECLFVCRIRRRPAPIEGRDVSSDFRLFTFLPALIASTSFIISKTRFLGMPMRRPTSNAVGYGVEMTARPRMPACYAPTSALSNVSE